MGRKFRDQFTDPKTIKKIEDLEKTPQNQARLRSVKEGMKEKIKKPFYIGCLGLLLVFITLAYLKSYGVILLCLAWYFGTKYLRENQASLARDYTDHFLRPVLQEILPETRVNYFEKMDVGILQKLVPGSEGYYSNCHILFGDDLETEFCNMQSYHYIKDSDGNDQKRVDFTGQVLAVKLNTQIKGHIRIVPLVKENFLGHKSYGQYGEKRREEEEIQTESLVFNQAYSIFSTDAFYSRLILDPHILDILNHWKDKMKLCLYLDQKQISLAFESREFLFSVPKTPEDIDKLSLAGEYEKIQEKLADFYDLIDRIVEKLY